MDTSMDADVARTKEMFAKMAADGLDLSLNLSSPLQWGYFLVHAAPEPLVEVAEEMRELGYSCESLHQADGGQWVLQLAKVEIHTAESLHQRNLNFNELAATREIDLYDGWDVSVPGTRGGARG
jgi:hypothetical protein